LKLFYIFRGDQIGFYYQKDPAIVAARDSQVEFYDSDKSISLLMPGNVTIFFDHVGKDGYRFISDFVQLFITKKMENIC
jgi:hypothetical protein